VTIKTDSGYIKSRQKKKQGRGGGGSKKETAVKGNVNK